MFSAIWDFLKNFYNNVIVKVTDYIRSIFSSILQGFASVIHWIVVKWEELKFHFGQWIAKFYNTTVGFWTIALAIVGFVTLTAWLGPTVAKFIQKGLLSSWVKTLQTTLAHWTQVLHLNLLVEVNRIAIAVFPHWRQIWAGIYQDVGSVAGDIGYGFGTIAAMLTAGKGILVNFNTVLGLTKEQADVTALAQMSGYIQGLSNQFDRYAQNPQDIWNDFYDIVILPNLKQVHTYFSGIVAAIPEIEQRITALEQIPQQVLAFQAEINKRLGISPPATIAGVEASLAANDTKLNNFINTNVLTPLTNIQKSIAPLINSQVQHDSQIKQNSKDIATLKKGSPAVREIQSALFTGAGDTTSIEAELTAYFTQAPANAGDIYLMSLLVYAAYRLGTITENDLNTYIDTIGTSPTAITPPALPKPVGLTA